MIAPGDDKRRNGKIVAITTYCEASNDSPEMRRCIVHTIVNPSERMAVSARPCRGVPQYQLSE